MPNGAADGGLWQRQRNGAGNGNFSALRTFVMVQRRNWARSRSGGHFRGTERRLAGSVAPPWASLRLHCANDPADRRHSPVGFGASTVLDNGWDRGHGTERAVSVIGQFCRSTGETQAVEARANGDALRDCQDMRGATAFAVPGGEQICGWNGSILPMRSIGKMPVHKMSSKCSQK
jgi:hypothetical protein